MTLLFLGRRSEILEKLVKALFEWLASLWYEMVEYLLDQLIELFNVNLRYFETRVPVISDIANIFVAVGWALLIGNLAFQALRSMASGTGIEAEDPGRLFLRTAMFSFLLFVSREICRIGLGLSAMVMEMLQVPDAITFDPLGEETFDMLPNSGWIFVIIINIIIQWQLIRLFFEVAERYVILCVLTYCAPLAFAMGGAKSTSEIFRGWLRMFASMCALMVFNLMFVKLVLSALSTDPNGFAIIPWAMLVVGIVRMAKKMDGIILRIGMNPALTGDPLGMRFPGALTAMTLHSMREILATTAARNIPHGNTTKTPPKNDPTLYPNIAGGPAKLCTHADGSGAASGGASRQRPAGHGSVAVKGTGSGARMTNTITAFRNRYGADNAEAMRQVRQMITIDADDWDENSFTGGSTVLNSSASHPVSGTGGRSVPPVPPIRPLPADLKRVRQPNADGESAPVMPLRGRDGQNDPASSPVTPQTAMPRSPEQALRDFADGGPAPEKNDPSVSAQGQGAKRIDYTWQPGKISPSISPYSCQKLQNNTSMDDHTSLASAEKISLHPAGRSEQASQHAPFGEKTVLSKESSTATSNGMISAAAAAGSVAAAQNTGKPVSVSRMTPPAAENGVSPARQAAMPYVPDSAHITPAVSHKPAAQAAASPAATQGIPTAAPAGVSQQANKQMTPKTQTAAPPAERMVRPAASPARRERKSAHHDAADPARFMQNVRTPDMVVPPPVSQPRTLKRSAQPLKNKAASEKSKKEGGNRNRKRKRRGSP